MPDLLEHLAQFAVAAFDQHHFVPGIVALPHLPDAGGRGLHPALSWLAALDAYPFAKPVQFLFGRLPAHLHQVRFLHARGSFGQLVG
jgi:hypothetical protein